MKILFSHYQFIINELSQLAFEFGFKCNLSMYFCDYLKLKGKPYRPARECISRREMIQLYALAYECYNDVGYFVKVLGI